MSARTNPTIGVLLAGGLARRMGGGDKSLRAVAGRTMLDRAIAAMRPQCAHLMLSANGDPARFAATGLAVIGDGVPGSAGPLAGILAALDWIAEHYTGIEWAVSVAADSPFLPRDLVARLHAGRAAAGAAMSQARSGGRIHPVNALWPVGSRQDLRRALLLEDMRKVGSWTARQGAVSVDWDCKPVDPFFNANTPDDIAEADRLAAELGI